MRELLTLQFGQAGAQIGGKFWGQTSAEHGLTPTTEFEGDSHAQLLYSNILFHENSDETYTARSLFLDLDSSALDSVRTLPFSKLFSPENFISGKCGSNNIFSTGYGQLGHDLAHITSERVSKLAEVCESFSGFQLLGALGGGCASGLGARVLDQCLEEFPSKLTTNYCLLPGPLTSDNVLEPYNVVLGLSHLLNSGMVFLFDNEALYQISQRKLGITKPIYADLNHIVAQVMSNLTCSSRFAGE